jgi:biotin synthase-related radical SAM superfamily protein
MKTEYKGFLRRLPKLIRVSVGSAVVLGLTKARLDAKPTTVYLLTYRLGKCSANCSFCPQAKTSKGRADMLSRVIWPPFPTLKVFSEIKRVYETEKIQRVCIQALNYPKVFNDLMNLIEALRLRVNVPLSVSCQPLNRDKMKKLRDLAVSRICVPLDAANKPLFDKVKGSLAGGPYVWDEQRRVLKEAVEVFGRDSVSTHLIAGLGETAKDLVEMIQWCVDLGVYPGLFSFTPIKGTVLEDYPQPSLRYYRKVQTAHFLITLRKTRFENMKFDGRGCLVDFGISKPGLKKIITSGFPFVTSGCPGCNRPYYNERPGGPLYNYPVLPSPEEIAEIVRQIGIP